VTSEEPLVSVIVACYNQARFLGDCLRSLVGQSHRHLEVIVVDDGSDDDPARIAAEFGERVTCVRQPNSGPSAARNKGISMSHGEYIAFCDADDALDPACIARRLLLLQEHPSAGLATGSILMMDESGSPLDVPPEAFAAPFEIDFERSLTRNWGATCGTVVRREAIERCGAMDPFFRTCEDWDLQVRVATRFTLVFDPTPLAMARRVSGSLSRDSVRLYDDARRLLRKARAYAPSQWRFYWLAHRALFLQCVGFTLHRMRTEMSGLARFQAILRFAMARPSILTYLGAWAIRFIVNRARFAVSKR
jgi:glycosyltransferase involved in cell wall biosynthesis